MAIYPYSFTMPPVNKQDIPSDGVVGEFLGISAGGVLDWLPVAGGGGSGDMLKAENLSGLADYAIARTNIGLGLTSSPEFANLTLTSPSLSSSAPVTISQTWNGTGSTVFKALVVNATTPGTTSSSSSLLFDLQVGGLTKFNVRKDGSPTPGTQFIGYRLTGYTNYALAQVSGYTAICNPANGVAFLSDNNFNSGAAQFLSNHIGVSIGADQSYSWKDSAYADSGTTDTILRRDGAPNTLALRNGALAQTFRVYNTYTDASNFERVAFAWAGNTAFLDVGASGSGTRRDLNIGAQNVSLFSGSGPTLRWQINSSGHFIAGTDNSYDIGASGASRPRNIYAGSNIYAAGNVGIGTTAPGAPLHVQGTAIAGRESLMKASVSDAGNDAFHIYNATSANGIFVPGFSGSVFSTNSPAALIAFVGQTTQVNDIGGNAMLFQVRRTDNVTDPNNGVFSELVSKTLFAWQNHVTTHMAMLANGNLGIGTTAPSEKLHVVGNAQFEAASPYINLRSSASGLNYYIQSNSNVIGTGSGDYLAYLSPNGKGHTWTEVSTARMMIQPTTGNVGIGTTAPKAKLHVIGGDSATTFTAATIALGFGTGSLPYPHFIHTRHAGVAAGNCIDFYTCDGDGNGVFPTNAVHGLTIENGKVGIGTTSPTSKLHVAGTIKPEQATMVDKAAGFTLAAVDAGTVINSTSATAITINLPAADTAAGYNVMIIQSGAGAVTIAANGNTLNSFGNALITAGQHAACSIVRTAASTYNLSGNLV